MRRSLGCLMLGIGLVLASLQLAAGAEGDEEDKARRAAGEKDAQPLLMQEGRAILPAGRKPVKPSGNTPVIADVAPKDLDGHPYLLEGQKITILGENFGADKSKVKIGVRTYVEGNPQIPAPIKDFVKEIAVTSAKPERLEATAPGGIGKNRYLIWVHVEGGGHSKPVAVWLAPKPVQKPRPTLTKMDPA